MDRRKVFLDDGDPEGFLQRFARRLPESGTGCLAWCLLPNHLHPLLRIRRMSPGPRMRRLLTGCGVTFDLRHRRSGHLAQTRYPSTVCEEEGYLPELVGYTRLNPLRTDPCGIWTL